MGRNQTDGLDCALNSLAVQMCKLGMRLSGTMLPDRFALSALDHRYRKRSVTSRVSKPAAAPAHAISDDHILRVCPVRATSHYAPKAADGSVKLLRLMTLISDLK